MWWAAVLRVFTSSLFKYGVIAVAALMIGRFGISKIEETLSDANEKRAAVAELQQVQEQMAQQKEEHERLQARLAADRDAVAAKVKETQLRAYAQVSRLEKLIKEREDVANWVKSPIPSGVDE